MKTTSTDRRDFIKKAGLLTAGFAFLQFPVWAKSVFAIDYPKHNIPEEKNIDPQWLKSLFNRGQATACLKSKNELKYIGMPVGGLHAGTVYVGGDGRLWLWQIYNETFEGNDEGIDPKVVNWNDRTSVRKIRVRDGAAYVEPTIADNKRVLDQGFAVKLVINGKTIVKELNEEDWVIQDRYHASKRNPFNEIECSDHYARAMASYGTFITACGFTCHGPKGELGFAPKWNKENFKLPFTTAKAWGTYVQKKTGMKQSHLLKLSYGDLSLQKLTLEKIGTGTLKSVTAILDQLKVPLRFKQQGQVLEVIFDNRLLIKENQSLSVVFS